MYGHGILYFKNADDELLFSETTTATNRTVQNLSHTFQYPIALTYDPKQKNFYIADLNDRMDKIFQMHFDETIADVRPILHSKSFYFIIIFSIKIIL